eukprot:206115-Rhodomonas_salina.3
MSVRRRMVSAPLDRGDVACEAAAPSESRSPNTASPYCFRPSMLRSELLRETWIFVRRLM